MFTLSFRSQHHLGFVPVEFLAAYRNHSTHFLHHALLHLLEHFFDRGLVGRFNLVNLLTDRLAIAALQCDSIKLLIEVELDIAVLKEVVVHTDGPSYCLSLNINDPLRLPLTAPAVAQIQIDAADVDLQVADLVEAQTGTSSLFFVMNSHVLLDTSIYCLPIQIKS